MMPALPITPPLMRVSFGSGQSLMRVPFGQGQPPPSSHTRLSASPTLLRCPCPLAVLACDVPAVVLAVAGAAASADDLLGVVASAVADVRVADIRLVVAGNRRGAVPCSTTGGVGR